MVRIAPSVQAVGRSRVPRDRPSASKPLRQRIKPCWAGSGRRPVVRFQHWGLAKCYSGLESSECGGLVCRRTVLTGWLLVSRACFGRLGLGLNWDSVLDCGKGRKVMGEGRIFFSGRIFLGIIEEE